MAWLFCIITALYGIIILFFLIGLFWPTRTRTSKKYRVSVVVAARNEAQNIGNLLTELQQQTYPAEWYEVIIVDDGSEDRTAEIVDQFARRDARIRLIQVQPDQTPGLIAKKKALNQGIQQSTGEIILSTDADCHVQPTWIETMVSYFTDEVGFVVGFSQLGNPGYRYSLFEGLQAVDFLSLMAAAQGCTNFDFPLAASGQNLAYRKEAFLSVGGFEKVKNRVSGDDVLLLQLVRKYTPWKIRFASAHSGFNWTKPEKTLRAFLNQRKRWASNGAFQMRLNIIFFMFIFVTFLMNIIAFVGAPIYFWFTHSLLVPLIILGAKFLIEFLLTFKGALVYQRTDLLKYFPLWMVLQMPYVIFTGLMGSLGRFIWKERRFSQDLTIFRMHA
ncbi:MAG: glycosyltransferase [candidate division KSB1 bacterium]|nr:glycosyltransferase [candidate division KSB1 bacterium]MDZ7340205.1 glycosyltransferase [candidate division KSB1 bacterium]